VSYTNVKSLGSNSEVLDIVEFFIIMQPFQYLACSWRFRKVPGNSDRVCQIVPNVAPAFVRVNRASRAITGLKFGIRRGLPARKVTHRKALSALGAGLAVQAPKSACALCCTNLQPGEVSPGIRFHVRRTYSGRPSSSMRFSDATAIATSVVCRPSVRGARVLIPSIRKSELIL
jgi:hypothetical protein